MKWKRTLNRAANGIGCEFKLLPQFLPQYYLIYLAGPVPKRKHRTRSDTHGLALDFCMVKLPLSSSLLCWHLT